MSITPIEIRAQDLGYTEDLEVLEVLVRPGDEVTAGDPIITLESANRIVEIVASHVGRVQAIDAAVGKFIRPRDVMALIQPRGDARSPSTVEARMPDIGDMADVEVIELLATPGEWINGDQSLVTVESDKAALEVPSSAAGVLKEFKIKVGDKINVGDLLAILEISAAVEPAPAAPSDPLDSAVAPGAPAGDVVGVPAKSVRHVTELSRAMPHASPSVRQFARERGIDLEQVTGTGANGGITMSDVLRCVAVMPVAPDAGFQDKVSALKENALALIPWPKLDFSRYGATERRELGRIRKVAGANLLRNAVMIPSVTNHDDADITDLEAFRLSINKENQQAGVKLTMLAFLISACVATLKKFPEFNSSLDGDALIVKQFWHIGFAVDTAHGLMVPVIRDADKKGVLSISHEMGDLARKARDGKLSQDDMSGATFTISSLGGIGGRYFTPIINAPEVAILGVSRSRMEPVWDGSAFQPRLMLPLSLTWDHRVVDGAAAARFNAYLCQTLSDFRRVLL